MTEQNQHGGSYELQFKPYFDLDKLQVGDKLWDFVYGWGEVVRIDDSCEYPIQIHFKLRRNQLLNLSFTANGEKITDQTHQTLFYDEIKFDPPPRPKRIVKKEGWLGFWKDSKGTIKIYGGTGYNKYFSPRWFTSKEEAMGYYTELKGVPKPVKVEWEEEE